MSLFTRTILLMSIFVLAVTMSAGLNLLNDSSASAIDRFVAARNQNRAIAYQTVALQGGRVATSTPGRTIDDNQEIAAEGNPGATVKKSESMIADAAWEAFLTRSQLEAEANKYVTGWTEAGVQKPSLAQLNEQIASGSKKYRDELLGLNKIGDDFRSFAIQIGNYRNTIAGSMQAIFNLDYQVHRAVIDMNALKAERLQIEAEEGRVRADIRELENQNYNLNRSFEQTVKTIAMYEKYAPEIRAAANREGRPWLRGEVVRVADDRMSGLVWINIGTEDGAIEGQRLAIHREGRFIAYVRVQSVGAGESLARLEPGFRDGERIATSDQVRVAANFGNRS